MKFTYIVIVACVTLSHLLRKPNDMSKAIEMARSVVLIEESAQCPGLDGTWEKTFRYYL